MGAEFISQLLSDFHRASHISWPAHSASHYPFPLKGSVVTRRVSRFNDGH